MSAYTGKCDVYDTLVMIHNITDFSNVKIYAYGNDIIPLRIDSQKDLMPYYPYLTSSMSKSDNGIIVHLSKESYIDEEEKNRLTIELEIIKRYARKCKRNKEPFDENKALDLITMFYKQDYQIELVNRVKKQGDKATIDDIHIPSSDRFRQMLFEDMIAAGYETTRAKLWCFGWRRAIDDNNGKD